ncbi:hypothetical protein FACS1894147_00160 [Spirochaetia bacterium]|nr:hypothetical protein FACS1894147_00160 [Spirochaetia bacterium]
MAITFPLNDDMAEKLLQTIEDIVKSKIAFINNDEKELNAIDETTNRSIKITLKDGTIPLWLYVKNRKDSECAVLGSYFSVLTNEEKILFWFGVYATKDEPVFEFAIQFYGKKWTDQKLKNDIMEAIKKSTDSASLREIIEKIDDYPKTAKMHK